MKKTNVFLALIALSAGIIGISLKWDKEEVKVEAAPIKTADSKIRFTFNGYDNWEWDNGYYKIRYSGAVVSSGSYNDWTSGSVNISEYFVLPSNVTSIWIGLDGRDGKINSVHLTSHGDWSLGSFQWQDPNRVITRNVRVGDYFEKYSAEEGYGGGVDELRTRLWFYRGHYGKEDGYVALNINDRLIKASGHSHAWLGDDHHNHFAYFDVLLTDILNKNIKFHKIKADNTEIWNTSTSIKYVAGMSSFLFMIDAINGDMLTAGSNPNRFRSGFFAKVLEGYLTCSSSIDNGYGAFENMKNNFFKTGSDSLGFDMDGNPSVESISDYSGKGTDNYGSSRGTGVLVTAEAKYHALQNMHNSGRIEGGQGIVSNSPNQNANATVVITILGLVTLGGYYFLSRKKKTV